MPGSSTSTRKSTSSSKVSTNGGSENAGEVLLESEREGPHLRLPVLGELTLPPVEHLAWYGAIAVLTAVELIDWPVAAVIAVGKALADNRHSQTLQNVGEAFENAH